MRRALMAVTYAALVVAIAMLCVVSFVAFVAVAGAGTHRDHILNCLSDRSMTVTLEPLTIGRRRVHVLVFAPLTSKTGLYLAMNQKRCYLQGPATSPAWQALP